MLIFACLINLAGHFLSGGLPKRKSRELRQAMFLSHGQKLAVDISHARIAWNSFSEQNSFVLLYMLTRQRGRIKMQAKEKYFIARHFGIRCISSFF